LTNQSLLSIISSSNHLIIQLTKWKQTEIISANLWSSVIKATLHKTEFAGIPIFRRGKVRDVYDLGDKLLIVATDRISAFDCVLPNAIPGKGAVLTQMSIFWFDLISDLVINHMITADPSTYPEQLRPFEKDLNYRSMLVRRTEAVPVECVARGYLAGSGWKEYKQSGEVCGIRLPKGLVESDKLPETIFTPATKAETGHDENISEKRMAELIGKELTEKLKDLTISIYNKAARFAEERGIIICDTKFEFGIVDNEIILIDELLTPDSSRFWPKESYKAGHAQPSFDKQYVRDYLETLTWDKQPPAPELPQEIVAATSERYLEAYRLLTGKEINL
jgi:phosphoribosylaminoimidazole-succinocarboxamide synthase